MMDIIKASTSELSKSVKSFSKRSKTFHADMHVLAVSCLYHAAEHGECTPINSFYNDALPTAYQTAFKLFVKRIMDDRGYATGEWLGFERGIFFVKENKSAERGKFKELVDGESDEADEFAVKSFFDYDPLREAAIFDSEALYKRLNALIKQARKDDASIPDEVIAVLEGARADVARVAHLTVQ